MPAAEAADWRWKTGRECRHWTALTLPNLARAWPGKEQRMFIPVLTARRRTTRHDRGARETQALLD